jgi:hypothetical protein
VTIAAKRALLDISTGGARLRLKATAERLLYLVDSFEMRFCLPDSDTSVTLTVDIRHRAACREGVAYGVRFDADRSPEFLEQLEEISAFVLQRME